MTATSASAKRRGPLLGSFEENVLNNRLEPVRTVDGYSIELRASGHFQPRPLKETLRVSFFSAGDTFPYLGQIHFSNRGYRIPKKGTLQVTLFNPLGTVVKLFLLIYDLIDMPPNSQTFLRQRTVFYTNTSAERSPTQKQARDDTSAASESANQSPTANQRACSRCHLQRCRVRYLIQFNIISSKSGRIYLNKDLRIYVSKKVDLEAASQLSEQHYELKSFDEMPKNPRYFSR